MSSCFKAKVSALGLVMKQECHFIMIMLVSNSTNNKQTLKMEQCLCIWLQKVKFLIVNQQTRKLDERSYHFPLHFCEKVYDMQDFYERHMTKIAEHLHDFNEVRNLLIKYIGHSHLLNMQ